MVPGKARVERNGTDCALLVSGPLLGECLRAAEILEEKKVFASVTHFHTVKPLDEETLRTISRFFPRAFTVEEHGACGGFGEALFRRTWRRLLADLPVGGGTGLSAGYARELP